MAFVPTLGQMCQYQMTASDGNQFPNVAVGQTVPALCVSTIGDLGAGTYDVILFIGGGGQTGVGGFIPCALGCLLGVQGAASSTNTPGFISALGT